MALAGRDPLWARCDRRAVDALFGAIRHCIGARGCSDVWIEQILSLFLFIARDLQKPKDDRPTGAWAAVFQEANPYAGNSAIGVLLRMLLMCAYGDSEGALREPGFHAVALAVIGGNRRCSGPGL